MLHHVRGRYSTVYNWVDTLVGSGVLRVDIAFPFIFSPAARFSYTSTYFHGWSFITMSHDGLLAADWTDLSVPRGWKDRCNKTEIQTRTQQSVQTVPSGRCLHPVSFNTTRKTSEPYPFFRFTSASALSRALDPDFLLPSPEPPIGFHSCTYIFDSHQLQISWDMDARPKTRSFFFPDQAIC